MNSPHFPSFAPAELVPGAVAIRRNDDAPRLQPEASSVAGAAGVTSKTACHGVVLTGPDRIVRTINAAFTAITGYTKADMVGQTCRILQGPLTDPRTLGAIQRALTDGTEFTDRIQNYRKDGSTFWNHLSISPVRNTAGLVTYYIGIVRDLDAPNGTAAVPYAESSDAGASTPINSERQLQGLSAHTAHLPSASWPGTWIAGAAHTWAGAFGLNVGRIAA
ncbi:PAS domain-containing protein [Horticoccus sp. 23ND18S-11]|uniref:PAS domain-containing protein n=1 Tax=Horticoccus sp. 23ND18S-11 TaxID=3391832 RepID=UPI0039C97CB4